MTQKNWEVYKFGGTSMKNADALKQVGNLIMNSDSDNLIVVVSAMSGMTDDLLSFSQTKDEKLLEAIESRYIETVGSLLKDSSGEHRLIEEFRQDIQKIKDLAEQKDHSFMNVEENEILGFGEIWSSKMLHDYLTSLSDIKSSWINPMEFLVIRNQEMGANVNWSKSKEAFNQSFQDM